MEGKRRIHIINIPHSKCSNPRKNLVEGSEDATVVMFDGFQPEATNFISSRFIASG
jgi:hypothetical protein